MTSRSAAAPPTPRSGTRWSTASAMARAAPADRAARGRQGRRRREDAGDDGRTYVPPPPAWDIVGRNLSRERSSPSARAWGPSRAWARSRRSSHFSVMVRGSGQLFVAGRRPSSAAWARGQRRSWAPGVHTRRRCRQRGRERGRRVRADPPLPVLPAVERLGGAAAVRRGTDDPRARGGAAVDHPRDRARLQDAQRPRAGARRGSLFEIGAAFGRPTITGWRGWTAGRRRARQRPRALRRRRDGRRRGEDGPLRRPVRPVPPAGRELRRSARLPDRHRGRARGDDPPRRARARGVQASVPWVSILVPRSTAWPARATARLAANLRFAWPSGNWGSLLMAGGSRRLPARLEAARTRAAEIAATRRVTSPFRTAGASASRRSSTRATRARSSALGQAGRC